MATPSGYNAAAISLTEDIQAGRMVLKTARETCRELIALLMEENAHVAKHKVAFIESKLQDKKRLTLRMEQLLLDIRKYAPTLKTDTTAKNELIILSREVQVLQDTSVKNHAVLKAAHQIRADLVMTIRDVVDANQPRPQLYGANGRITPADNNTRLVARNV